MKEITVAHSPDSDDAFMFYALVNNKIDTGDLKFVRHISICMKRNCSDIINTLKGFSI